MFAEADVFWKWPTLYDVLSVIGLVLGIVSIWIAFHLARRQLRVDFRKAADEAVDRVAQLVLADELAEGVHYLREADRAIANRDWNRALIRMEDGASVMARLIENQRLAEADRKRLMDAQVVFRDLIQVTKEHQRSPQKRGHLEVSKAAILTQWYLDLEQLRGRMTYAVLS